MVSFSRVGGSAARALFFSLLSPLTSSASSSAGIGTGVVGPGIVFGGCTDPWSHSPFVKCTECEGSRCDSHPHTCTPSDDPSLRGRCVDLDCSARASTGGSEVSSLTEYYGLGHLYDILGRNRYVKLMKQYCNDREPCRQSSTSHRIRKTLRTR